MRSFEIKIYGKAKGNKKKKGQIDVVCASLKWISNKNRE